MFLLMYAATSRFANWCFAWRRDCHRRQPLKFGLRKRHVRFTPKNGLRWSDRPSPVRAKRGHPEQLLNFPRLFQTTFKLCDTVCFRDMTEKAGGVLISDGRSSVRLSRAGPPNELGYPTIIDVRAGPFQGSVLDKTVGVGGFREQLAILYESLKGDAKLGSYDGFVELAITGNGSGGMEVRVKAVGDHTTPIQLTFAIYIDQSYLPAIIEQIDIEFPPPYRTAV
jgi:hypothetical protein